MNKLSRRGIALGLVAGLVAIPASIPALAQDGAPAKIEQRQSVVTELSSTGETGTSRVYTQLTVAGDGPVEVVLPGQSTRGLRDLGGLGRPGTDGDDVIFGVDATPTGVHKRTIAHHTADLPVEVEVAYQFNGERVEDPGDIVGRTGELTVTYTMRNTTATPTEIDVVGPTGSTETETVDVGVPLVGLLSLPLDGRFADVRADGANVAGDGRGNTIVNWDLVLFEPLGRFEQEVSWSARVSDAIIPDVTAEVVPVSSDTYQLLPDAMSRFSDVYAATTQLAGTGGAGRVNMVVAGLADGVSQLLDGMNQLADGSEQLADGLQQAASGSRDLADGTGQAASGSRDLADGTGQAASGSRDLADGTGQAASGSRDLAAGTGQAAAGSRELASGLGELRDGAGQLAGGAGQIDDGMNQLAAGLSGAAAPGAEELAAGLKNAALPGAQQILDGLKGLLAAVGLDTHDATDGTVLGGLNALIAGLTGDFTDGLNGMAAMTGGLVASFGPDPDAGGLHAGEKTQLAVDGVSLAHNVLSELVVHPAYQAGFKDQILTVTLPGVGPVSLPVEIWLEDGVPPLGLPPVVGTLAQVRDGLQDNVDGLGDWPGSCVDAITAVMTAEAMGVAPDGLAVILAQHCIAEDLAEGMAGEVIPGLVQLRGGMNNPACDLANPTDPSNPCGFKQVLELLTAGQGDLVSGLGDAASGAGELAAGIGDAAAGSQELAAGTGQLTHGARQLADGSVAAASGGRDLSIGLNQIDDGASQLASGLRQIDDGANQLSDGLGQIDDGANQLSDGLGQIDDGANQLADGLGDAASGSGDLAEGMGSARDGTESVDANLADLDEYDMPRLLAGLDRTGADSDRLLKQARAADERAKAGEGLPYGVAEGADASAVYQFQIAGVGTDEGLSTPVRAGAAVLAFAAVGGLGLGVRRRLI